MIDTKALREKILDLAMRGKLVPQDRNDEPASELLKRIKAEKEDLIKQKKIKRDKNETEIFRGDDGLHYEKFADGTVREVEVPYELPEGWEWTNIGSISLISSFESTKGQEIPIGSWVVELEDIEKETGQLLKRTTAQSSNDYKSNKYRFNSGTVLYGKLRPYLQKVILADRKGFCTTEIFPVKLSSGFIPELLYHLLFSKRIIEEINTSTYGVNLPRVNPTFFKSLMIPLPPFQEQQRIIDEINLGLVELRNIDKNQSDLKSLATQLKEKVLDVAMKGKLVPQDPNDEPVSVLLEKIRAEKQKLFEEGKLKKKDLEEITVVKGDDNAYYGKESTAVGKKIDLHYLRPNNWYTSRLKSMVITIPTKRYQIKQSEIRTSGKFPVISQSANIIEGFSDRKDKVLQLHDSLVIFGDHTRNVKLVSESFIVGADGVKILKAIYSNPEFLKLQLEHALQYVKDRGYARHYSYLEKEWISTPNVTLQNQIIDKVSQIDEAVNSFSQY
ncbi:MAG: restriction endonuclease subunit S [Streptococcaceae bacterium]|jgi:restriction endonuclease S subunit|nr:restriction endonuclease subunit S [Streptococcaceae bacterium]MCH4176811.1 restriction endonuclease subunit S [Streptococcaceae bacterium]